MSDTSSSEKDTSAPRRSKWLWGLLGLASVAAIGLVVSRSATSKSSKVSGPLSDLQLINRIDAALSQAGISGVEVYLRQQKVVLIALPDCREELQRAVDVVQHIEGVQLIDALIRDTTIFSDSAAKS